MTDEELAKLIEETRKFYLQIPISDILPRGRVGKHLEELQAEQLKRAKQDD